MSHVKQVRKIFENNELESLDISPLQLRNKDQPFHTFKRAQTLIDFRRFDKKCDFQNGENVEQQQQRREEKTPNSLDRENESQARRHFERQNSNNSDSSTYRSVRRSPAFRRADAEKKPVTPPKVKLTRQSPITKHAVKKEIIDELQYIASSETIKKALRSPLPPGPAPKKPPRTFAATSPQSSPSRDINIAAELEKREDLKEQQVQSPIDSIKLELEKKLHIKPKSQLPKKRVEEKKTLGNIFQCIIPTCSIDPIYKEQIRREQSQKRPIDDEQIYMEPFAHNAKEFNLNDNSFSSSLSSSATTATPAKTEELHYMCTNLNIFDQTNNNINHQQSASDSRRSSLDEDNNYYSTNSSEIETNESYDKVHCSLCANILFPYHTFTVI